MAITVSGLYFVTFSKALCNTIALDLNSETDQKIALYNNSLTTPNFDTDTVQSAAPYNANEVTSAAPWPAGGVTLTTTTVTVASGTLQFQTANVSVASTTLSSAYGALVYGLSAGTKDCLAMVYFGGSPYSTNNGTFAITWNAAGIFTIDLTP